MDNETLLRSRWHKRDNMTLRHCVALVDWQGRYSTHYEVQREDGTRALDSGHYFDSVLDACEDFTIRAREFEARYAASLENDQ